jgi:tetratricopeptide (TPR) repeat protein
VAGIIIIAGLAGLHLVYRKRFDRRVFFYAGWVLLFMVPGMLYYPKFYYISYEHVDHRAYITCFGLLLLSLNMIQTFGVDIKIYFKGFCLLLLAYLVAFNIHFSGSYRNPSEFALSAIRTGSNSANAFSIYGTELYLAGRDDEALYYLNRSIHIFNRFTPALYTRAMLYRKHGMNSEALADLDTIVAFDPGFGAGVFALRAEMKNALGDYEGAISDNQAALRFNP